MMKLSCATCQAFKREDGKGQKGFCHLSPPTVLLAGVQPPKFPGLPAMPITVSAWPMVSETDQCRMWMRLQPSE
jgi:hypothetical protein